MKKKDIKKARKVAKERKPMSSKDKFMLACLVTLIMYLGIMLPVTLCVSAVSWHWFVVGLVAVIIPFAFINIRLIIQDKVPLTVGQQKKANISTVKNILYFWFLDCLYIVIFNQWIVWIYILGIAVIIKVFYSLVVLFLGKKQRNTVYDISLVLDLFLGIGLTVYLIYLIPEQFGNLQTIVTTIVAAVYGGLLTLVGVAWTIKQQEKIRQDEEKKKYRPIVLVMFGQIDHAKPIELKKISNDKISYTKTEVLSCETYINPIVIHNTDFTPFYIYGIMVNDSCLFTELKFYINRNDVFIVSFEQQTIFTQKEIDTIALLTQDLLGNFYKIPILVEKMLGNVIEKPVFTQGEFKILPKEISQIWCRDEQPAIELENFSLKED